MPLVKQSDTILQTVARSAGSDVFRIAYPGVLVQALNSGVLQPMYADAEGAQAITGATTDATGYYQFWVEEGAYSLEFSVNDTVLGERDYVLFNAARQTDLEAGLGQKVASADLASTASGKGAAMVAFKSGATGSVARNASEKLDETFSLRDAGAVGDGVADDSDAVERWGANANGRKGMPVAGTYRITRKVVWPIGFSTFDAMLGKCVFVMEGAGCIELNGGADYGGSCIEGISFHAKTAAPGTGWTALFFNAVRALRQSIKVSGCEFRSANGLTRTYGFDTCVRVHDAFKSEIVANHFDGMFNAFANPVGQPQQTAILATGVSTGVNIRDNLAYAFYTAIAATGTTVENLNVQGGEYVGVYQGINCTAFGGRPVVVIDNCHVNAVYRGAYIENAVDVTVDGFFPYRSASFYQVADWYGLHIKQGLARTAINALKVADSIVAGNRYGLVLEDCTGVTVNGYHPSNVNYPIHHRGTNTDVDYTGVVFNAIGATGAAITTTATDVDIWLGQHEFLGTTPASPYALGAPTSRTVRIESRYPRYHGTSLGNTISAASTFAFNPKSSAQVFSFNVAAGAGTYTANLDFVGAGDVLPGAFFKFSLSFASSVNPTIVLRNGSGGATLRSIAGTGSAFTVDVEVIWDGTNWSILSYNVRS